jgi:hypothetical protein
MQFFRLRGLISYTFKLKGTSLLETVAPGFTRVKIVGNPFAAGENKWIHKIYKEHGSFSSIVRLETSHLLALT